MTICGLRWALEPLATTKSSPPTDSLEVGAAAAPVCPRELRGAEAGEEVCPIADGHHLTLLQRPHPELWQLKDAIQWRRLSRRFPDLDGAIQMAVA